MKIAALSLVLLLTCSVQSQEISIIPQPKKLEKPATPGTFSISPSTLLLPEGSGLDKSVGFLNDYLQRFYGFKLGTAKNSSAKNVIRLNYEKMENPIAGAYRLTVDNKGVYIAGDNEAGVFYGIQTLIQLLPVPGAAPMSKTAKLNIPFVTIEDAPRFAYRGLHLDVCRHYMPVDFIKKYIDYIALHKMNYFHWHLTDDQGWRIEIKKYPLLTQQGGYRNGTITGRYPGFSNDSIRYGGFYTQEQVKEIVAYAQKRYITVIPEIEMPGHASAAIAAYPELSCFPSRDTKYPPLTRWNGPKAGKQVQQTWGVFEDVFCAGKEFTFLFLENVLEEVLPLFPSGYVHVGGDECPKIHWKQCPNCQQRMKDNGLKDEHELQSYFIQRMEKYLNKKGRTLIGWDEILEGGLAPNAVVMSWRGEAGGIEAAKQNHDVIMTPGNPVYFDHSQSENEDSVTIGGFNPLEKVYAYEPVPAELNAAQASHVLGAQANLWTEYIKNPSKAEYMLFPRLSALSEVLWSPKEKKNFDGFIRRMEVQFRRYDLWKANYSNAFFELASSVIPAPGYSGILWKLETKKAGQRIQYNKKLEATDPPNPPAFYTYSAPVPISVSGEYTAWATENGRPLKSRITQKFNMHKATGKKITELAEGISPKYPGSGVFTLVDGVLNDKGLSRSKEFLGYSGKDCHVLIDLGSVQDIALLRVHFLEAKNSWIYYPSALHIEYSSDGISYSAADTKNSAFVPWGVTCNFPPAAKARFIKVLAKNHGIIAEGNPGAGNPAWLFVDEIEVK